MFGAGENAQMGCIDPRQGVETCGMVEQMASDEIMLRFTGDPYWAENCEDVAFNSYPAAVMHPTSSRYATSLAPIKWSATPKTIIRVSPIADHFCR